MNLATNSDVNSISKCVKKNKKEMKKLETFYLSYFLPKILFGDNGFQNMFVYQPAFNMPELKNQGNWIFY